MSKSGFPAPAVRGEAPDAWARLTQSSPVPSPQAKSRAWAHQRMSYHRISLGQRLGLRRGDALIVIDVQRDFLPGGSLAIAAGNEVLPRINAYIAAFDSRGLPVFLTRDWHPSNHCSFRSAGGRWPPHCIRGTGGAGWPNSLKVLPAARIVSKGTARGVEGYSGFSGTSLLPLLRKLRVKRLFICGLATDYCVHDTVMDARSHNFEVVVLADAIRGVEAQPGDETRAIMEMIERGATWFQHSAHGEAREQPIVTDTTGNGAAGRMAGTDLR